MSTESHVYVCKCLYTHAHSNVCTFTADVHKINEYIYQKVCTLYVCAVSDHCIFCVLYMSMKARGLC